MDNKNYGGWVFIAIVIVLIIAKVTSPSPAPVDIYKVLSNTNKSTAAEIEREELRREKYGEVLLSEDEIADISERHVLNEIHKGNK